MQARQDNDAARAPIAGNRAPIVGNGRPACPICRQPVAQGARHFPFCSERCKLVDMGRWLGDRYCIESPIDAIEGDAPASGRPDEESPSEGTP